MNYKMIIEYDGTRYEGWQKQKHTMKRCRVKLKKLLKKLQVKMYKS